MPWCNHCGDDCDAIKDPEKGYICCTSCGKILDQDVYTDEPTFVKSGGQSRLAGTIVHSFQSGYSISRERTLERGRDEISDIVNNLGVGGGDLIINKAHRFYEIAIDRNFTRGRRTSHVAAACLYIACRQDKKPYLLIDFSDYLKINVYVLGAVFLQLCKVLRLAEHPIIQKLVDPCLFIHRFAERLLGRKNNAVSETALRIVASMKRDWMQTGRKPSGLCGAALYISALSHGLNYSKSNIVAVVHVCEATLTKRLIEFEETESGSLTIEEFLTRVDELDEESLTSHLPRPGEVLCKHKDTEEPHFAHGLCRKCYNKFLKISGGLDGGADPPAFQQAERQRIEKEKAEENMRKRSAVEMEAGFCSKSADAMESESLITEKPERHEAVDTSACNEVQEEINDPESLSDIDDAEVDGYLHNEEEKELKKIIWEEVNKDYVMEQAAKEAAAAAAKKARDELLENLPEEMRSAKELAEATAAALAKSRKEKRQKRAEEAKNATPAQTPLEATRKMLKQKAFSSRVNYKALEALYTEDEESMQKQQMDSDTGDPDARQSEIYVKENADSGTVANGEEAGTFKSYNDGKMDHDGDYDNGDENYAGDDDDDDDFGF